MPDSAPDHLNFEQQRKRAKDLLRLARGGDAAAIARLAALRPGSAPLRESFQLADAQLAVAREAGYESWPRLAAAIQARDVEDFRDAVQHGDAARARRLLALAHVRGQVNDPMFAFGQRAAHIAARNPALLEALLSAGADVNLKSDWQNGPYTVLDNADEGTARFLLARGATLTPNAAARLGWFDELRTLIDDDPALVHARGGDGQQPLHQAKTVAIADFLLDRGAGIDVPCIDHRSTPAQYALVERPDVCRRLLERGATPDIFMAARLGDVALAARVLDADPQCVAARINDPGYAMVPPLHIYCWTLGFGLSPHEVALDAGHLEVHRLLSERSPARVRLMQALLDGDERAARAILDDHPSFLSSMAPQDHSHLAQAIFHERFDAADLMLRLGFDPSAPGVDGGTALHAACWVGSVRLVERLLAQGAVPIDARDPTHGSTPLGWAAFGSVHRRARGGDYPAVVRLLLKAGADANAPGNRHGRTLVDMAQGNEAVQEVLKNG